MTDPLITPEMIRATLERQAKRHNETLAELSRMLGRRDHYLQRFVREGSPTRLKPQEAAMLAGYFRIDPRLLGGSGVAHQTPLPYDGRRLRTGSVSWLDQ